jgi:hypothetical protein
LVLISVSDLIGPTAIARLDGFGELKNSITSSGIERGRKYSDIREVDEQAEITQGELFA